MRFSPQVSTKQKSKSSGLTRLRFICETVQCIGQIDWFPGLNDGPCVSGSDGCQFLKRSRFILRTQYELAYLC